jgi:hypothetical protein
MAIEKVQGSYGNLGVPALIGNCFRGEEPTGDLLFALRDDGLYVVCTHDDTHEVKLK